METYLIQIEVQLPEGFNEGEVDISIANIICNRFHGQVLDSKEYEEIDTGTYLIQIEAELPEDFNESEMDTAIADLICNVFEGEVIDSKEYKRIN